MTKRTRKTESTITNETSENAALVAMHAALDARSAANDKQASFFAKQKKFFNVHCVVALEAQQVDVSKLAAMIQRSVSSASDSTLAKYAVEKVVKIARALSQNDFSLFDTYTQSIMLNARMLEKSERSEALKAKTALACLSNEITFNEDEVQQNYKRFSRCVATTASTQRSSTREALRALNAVSVTKNARDDSISFNDSALAHTLRAMCDATIERYFASRKLAA